MRFEFHPEKALEAILYVVLKARTDKYGTLKILYLADKLHLERYGRFISGDYYHALNAGPTPMLCYDLIEYAAGIKEKAPIDSRKAFSVGNETSDYALVPLRDPDLEELSDSDIECLDEVIGSLQGVDPTTMYRAMWDRVHDNAWKKVWERGHNGPMDITDIAEQFEHADELLQYLEQT
jgi:hypothetical protein